MNNTEWCNKISIITSKLKIQPKFILNSAFLTEKLKSPFHFNNVQVFLLALCEDNALYVRTLATGKELHTLKGHKSKVSDPLDPHTGC